VEALKQLAVYQAGPISYSETTTKDSVFNEDANRCLQIETDVSEGQTEAIKNRKCDAYMPGPPPNPAGVDEILQRHWEFQRSLKPVRVAIPWAKIISARMPRNLEVRRAIGYVLALYEGVTYLHQFQRETNEHGQVVAKLSDYALVRRLVLGSLQAAFGMGKEYQAALVIEAKLRKVESKRFTTNQAAEALQTLSRKTANAALQKMADCGLLCVAEEERGNRPKVWEWTGRTVDELVLPG
jgi:hypothetical protein